jgi:hypothetical protein
MTPGAGKPTTQSPDSGLFLMLAGSARAPLEREWLESGLRRMGLQPQRLPPAQPTVSGASWNICFGALSARIENAVADTEPLPLVNAWLLRLTPAASAVTGDPVAAARELLKLAVLLIDLCGAEQIYWSPADLWSDAAACRLAVGEMLDSGMPPVLHLVAFPDAVDGGSLMTRGLSHFCGQELWLHPAAGLDRLAQMRRLVRLAIDMTMNGPITAPRRFPGLVTGEAIQMDPRAGVFGMTQVVDVRIMPE